MEAFCLFRSGRHQDAAAACRRLLERFQQIDISLDPFPFGGITTTCDSIHMGVPLVTLAGDRFCARSGVSLLNSVGLPERIAASEDAYVSIAAKLASDLAAQNGLRRGLRARMAASPLRTVRGSHAILPMHTACSGGRGVSGLADRPIGILLDVSKHGVGIMFDQNANFSTGFPCRKSIARWRMLGR